MKLWSFWTFVGLVLLILAGPTRGSVTDTPEENSPTDSRPKIGLALSGGGARGLAHVGVLKELERLEIPIDFVVGTSIGALVGGMYALGMSPEEIEKELLEVSWPDIFRGKVPHEDLSFRRKEDELKYILGAEFGFGRGDFKFPRGAISSLPLDFFLEKLSLRFDSLASFDELRVPFRAVASDLRSGEVIILDRGELSTAIRASTTVPGILAPVEIGEYVLVDGGVLDNLPVNAALEMGADRVIAVDVATPSVATGLLDSPTAIVSRALVLSIERKTAESQELANVLIRPDLGKLSPTDFTKNLETIEAGTRAAQKMHRSLSELTDSRAFDGHLVRQRQPAPELPVVRSIVVDGTSRVTTHRVLARMETRVGEPLDLEILYDDLGRIHGIGEFDSVRFRLKRPIEEGNLVIELTDKQWGPNYLRVGLAFLGDLEGSNGFNLLLNYTRTNLSTRGAEWRNEVQTGSTRGFLSELFLPLDYADRWFVAPRIESRRLLRPTFVDRELVGEYDVENLTLGLDLGWQLGKYGELRIGVRTGEAEGEIGLSGDESSKIRVDIGAITGRFVIDRLDSAGIPRNGLLADVRMYHSEPSLGASDEYHKVWGEYSNYWSSGRHTALLGVTGGSSLDSEVPVYDPFFVGGLHSFSGYSLGELRGNYYGFGRGGYLYRFYDLPVAFGTAAYLGGWVERGNVWQTLDAVSADDLETSLTLVLAIDTRLGPVYLAAGLAEDGESQFHLRLGTRF